MGDGHHPEPEPIAWRKIGLIAMAAGVWLPLLLAALWGAMLLWVNSSHEEGRGLYGVLLVPLVVLVFLCLAVLSASVILRLGGVPSPTSTAVRAMVIMVVVVSAAIWLTTSYAFGAVQRRFEAANPGVVPWLVLAWLVATGSLAASIAVSYNRAREVMIAAADLLAVLLVGVLIATLILR